jgi:hypothetical protein
VSNLDKAESRLKTEGNRFTDIFEQLILRMKATGLTEGQKLTRREKSIMIDRPEILK